MNVFEAIKGRRSIRRYKPDQIPDAILEQVIEAARWAPSWANSQCCRLVVVKDGATKARIADALKQGNRSTEAVRNAPVVVVACAEMGKAGWYHGEMSTDKGDWYMFDVALAMENLSLAAHELGLGTVHVGLMNARKIEDALQVPEGVKVVELTPLGYPDEQPKGPGRKDIGEIAFYEKYGQQKPGR